MTAKDAKDKVKKLNSPQVNCEIFSLITKTLIIICQYSSFSRLTMKTEFTVELILLIYYLHKHTHI